MPYDYTRVTVASVGAETDVALAEADALVARAVAAEDVTFEARVAPLELAGARLTEAYGRGAFLAQAHTVEAVRDAASAAEERMTKWREALPFRQDLFASVSAVDADAEALTDEQRRVLMLWMRDFRRAGQTLSSEDRAELEAIRARLVELEIAFNRNVNEFQDGIEVTRAQLDGLPDEYVDRLKPGSTDGTYRVSLDYPEVYPYLSQASDRASRKTLFDKHWSRAVTDNRPLLVEALRLRQRAAELLGYPSWAHYAIEEKMAEHPEAVAAFYDTLLPRLTEARDRELTALSAALHGDLPGAQLAAWDWTYYDEQIRRAEYGVDANLVAEYLPMDACLAGMFELTGEVFGLDYRRVADAQAWHPSVELYEIWDRASGELIAHFYADWFPREGKFGHAAAFPLVVGHRRADGTYERPISAILANFTPPAGDRPSLVQHNELETLFHEFGHILHMSLTRASYARISGGEAEVDFVEAPSQIMEHWTWDASVLGRFARHYRTGEPIPPELVRQMIAARQLNIGLKTMVQVFYGQLDLGIHDGRAEPDLDEALRLAYGNVGLPYPEGTFLLAGFAHTMGGYDAGYYGYLWSEVIGDDMFGRFEAEGVTSPEVGGAYRREILEPNGSRPAAELVRAFLGRDPTPDAYLRLRGMT